MAVPSAAVTCTVGTEWTSDTRPAPLSISTMPTPPAFSTARLLLTRGLVPRVQITTLPVTLAGSSATWPATGGREKPAGPVEDGVGRGPGHRRQPGARVVDRVGRAVVAGRGRDEHARERRAVERLLHHVVGGAGGAADREVGRVDAVLDRLVDGGHRVGR